MALTTEKNPLDSLYKAVSSQIKINGQVLDASFEINQIATFKEVNKLSRARVKILGGDYTKNSFIESENSLFDPGNDIEIKFGYEQKLVLVFEGIISKHSISIQEGYQQRKSKSLLVIDCIDKAIALKNSFTTTIYKDKTDNQILTSLINNVSGLSSSIENTSYKHTLLAKYNSNDWEFLLKRAKINGCLVLNSNNSLTIKNPNISTENPVVKIENGGGTLLFEAHLDSSNQVNTFSFSSQNSFSGETYSKSGVEPNEIVTNNKNSAKKISSKSSPSSLETNFPYDVDPNELKIFADSITKTSRLQRVSGRAKFKGVLDIDLDTVVSLEGFGNRFDGNVYVTAVFHEINEGKIITEIQFGLSEEFFNKKLILDKNEYINPITGLHLGKVTQVHNDPEDQYRIKVLIPSLNDLTDGIWAKLTQSYTGDEFGSLIVPEVGTQVVVSFIGDDSRIPVVLGCLYSNDNKPYTSVDEQNNIKAFLTKSNLKLEFKEDKKQITISTPSGNSIILDEDSKEISIEDENKNSIKTSSSGIEMKSSKDITISSSGNLTLSAKGKINVTASTDLNMKGMNIAQSADAKLSSKANSNLELNSAGVATLKGSIVQIN
jgi:phage protein D/phage baseplate assembly protein gpV